METTVTMSLDRYKELEAKENTLKEYFQSGLMHYHRSSYGEYLTGDQSTITLLKDLENAINHRDNIIQKVREAEKKHGVKIW